MARSGCGVASPEEPKGIVALAPREYVGSAATGDDVIARIPSDGVVESVSGDVHISAVVLRIVGEGERLHGYLGAVRQSVRHIKIEVAGVFRCHYRKSVGHNIGVHRGAATLYHQLVAWQHVDALAAVDVVRRRIDSLV